MGGGSRSFILARLELASRHPTNRLAALRGNPALTSDQNALRAWVEAASSRNQSPLQKITPRRCRGVIFWSGRRGSNSLPPPWQGGALPDELRPRNIDDNSRFFRVCQAVIFIFPQILVLPPCKCGKAMINCLFVLTNTVCKETTLWPRFTKRSHAAGPLPSFLTPTPVRPR